ncbi:MAG TPA: hypothetical protein PLU53_03735 [Bacteroidia bacterium]|nr:hypothetical protein [Bacteroidia bacterium]
MKKVTEKKATKKLDKTSLKKIKGGQTIKHDMRYVKGKGAIA